MKYIRLHVIIQCDETVENAEEINDETLEELRSMFSDIGEAGEGISVLYSDVKFIENDMEEENEE